MSLPTVREPGQRKERQRKDRTTQGTDNARNGQRKEWTTQGMDNARNGQRKDWTTQGITTHFEKPPLLEGARELLSYYLKSMNIVHFRVI